MTLKRLPLVMILFLALACNYITRAIPTEFILATSTSTATEAVPITGAMSTLQPAWIPPDCTGTPVATLIPATEQAIPTPAIQANKPVDQQTQLQIFDQVVQTVNSVYVYPDFNGSDWNAIVTAHRALIQKGVSTEQFYALMQGLIGELGDNHSRFDSPVDVAQEQAELNGTSQFVGIGVLVIPDIKKNLISVGGVFPGTPADHAGLQPHDSILAVDGSPVVQDGQIYTYRIRGPQCSAVRITIQSPGQQPRDIMVIRHSIVGDLPVQARLISTTDGSKIGYIMLPSFFDEKIPGEVADALKNFGKLDGLIIDNRLNTGGSSDVLEPVLSYFVSGTLGNFKTRDAVTRPLTIQPDPIEYSQTVPMVILVGKNTVSFGEIFSGALQDSGRAKLVGEHTSGNVEILHGFNYPDGSMMWLAAETFDPAVHHTRWEGTGVIPDVQVTADWESFTFATDPDIKAALQILGHQ